MAKTLQIFLNEFIKMDLINKINKTIVWIQTLIRGMNEEVDICTDSI